MRKANKAIRRRSGTPPAAMATLATLLRSCTAQCTHAAFCLEIGVVFVKRKIIDRYVSYIYIYIYPIYTCHMWVLLWPDAAACVH
jgi:hypothetical protein